MGHGLLDLGQCEPIEDHGPEGCDCWSVTTTIHQGPVRTIPSLISKHRLHTHS